MKKIQEKRFRAAPIGSQIIFANRDPRSNDTAYEHENTIKLGPDLFIAHGIDGKNRNVFVSSEQIYNKLIECALGRPGTKEYADRNLFISTVTTFSDP
jgi:hypothetical protein